jgi:hypothetical protein
LSPDYKFEPFILEGPEECGPKMAMVRYDFMNDAVAVSDGKLCIFSQGGGDANREVYVYKRLWKVCTHSNGDYVSFCLFQG